MPAIEDLLLALCQTCQPQDTSERFSLESDANAFRLIFFETKPNLMRGKSFFYDAKEGARLESSGS